MSWGEHRSWGKLIVNKLLKVAGTHQVKLLILARNILQRDWAIRIMLELAASVGIKVSTLPPTWRVRGIVPHVRTYRIQPIFLVVPRSSWTTRQSA